MSILHGVPAPRSGTLSCYGSLRLLAKEIRKVMHTNGLGLIVARGETIQLESKPLSPAIVCSEGPWPQSTDTVAEQIRDFLAGRTHGEDLLHALYDYVLSEPIPERMLDLLQAGSTD